MKTRASPQKPATPAINPIYQKYIDKIATIPSARKVILVDDEEGPIIWTVIEAAPFKDAPRSPIYEAESEILRDSPEDVLIDFHVSNLSEYADEEEVFRNIGPHAMVMGQR
ncbi:MAG: hypothetical protein HY673_01085 [Chloroflexi bacterium]|nr:hypothetical protein [Chloroflexota bacterium]